MLYVDSITLEGQEVGKIADLQRAFQEISRLFFSAKNDVCGSLYHMARFFRSMSQLAMPRSGAPHGRYTLPTSRLPPPASRLSCRQRAYYLSGNTMEEENGMGVGTYTQQQQQQQALPGLHGGILRQALVNPRAPAVVVDVNMPVSGRSAQRLTKLPQVYVLTVCHIVMIRRKTNRQIMLCYRSFPLFWCCKSNHATPQHED